MNKLIKTLITMQSIDDKVAEKLKLVKKIPLEISDLKKEYQESKDAKDEAKEKLLTNRKNQNKIEINIAENEDHIAKNKGQLNQISNNKEYKSLNKEIANFQKKNKTNDEKLIKLMEKENKLVEALEEAKKHFKALDSKFQKESDKLEEEIKKEDETIEKLRAERNVLAKSTKKRNLVLKYANLIKQKNHIAVVPTTEDNACGGCGYNVIPQVQIDLKNAKKLIFCESCSRFLVDKDIFEEISEEIKKDK